MPDEERTVVKTTVPAYQKDIWVKHADELGMTQAEFVRTMVQAGRRGFELDPPETQSPAATPGVDGLEDHVLDILSSNGAVSFDKIVNPLVDDLEIHVDDVLQSLMDENRVRYSRREGYKLNGEYNGDD